MTTKRTPGLTADEEWKANRGPDPSFVGGVPVGPLGPGQNRLDLIPSAAPDGYEPGAVRHEVDGGERVTFDGRCEDRAHDWYTIGEREYRAPTRGVIEHPRGPRPAGSVVIVETMDSSNGHRVLYLVATPEDRKAHEAALAREADAAAHPLDGPFEYMPDVPLMVPGIRDVDDLLDHWRRMGVRPVRLGGSVTLTHPTAGPSIANLSSGQWHARPGDPDRDLVERWAPLIAARLGGRGVPCAVEGCGADAAVMLTGRVAICRPHLDTAVGAALPKRGGLRAAAASVTAALVRA